MAEILIVDDDAHINDMLSEALEAEGYSVIKSYSGTEALLLLENKIPDLVLLDLMIPGLSGEELLPKIKDTPVIVISAKSDVNDKVGLLLNGAADYITKPFNIKELLARITVQLRNSKNNITSKTVLSFEGIELNTDTHIVTVKKRKKKGSSQINLSEDINAKKKREDLEHKKFLEQQKLLDEDKELTVNNGKITVKEMMLDQTRHMKNKVREFYFVKDEDKEQTEEFKLEVNGTDDISSIIVDQ
ncbi:MAG: response regulator transcription factor, partial [Lachnospiraceae bacterium]|nr:response regulator transcription factor [Lachnospiraceae bacterium]